MTGTELIPITAWEQAAIIGIFVVFVGVLLTWFGKQSEKWQKFMFDIDEKWRAFSKEQREENNRSMDHVENSVRDLTTVTQALVSEVKEMRSDTSIFFEGFHAHDLQAREILSLAQKPPVRSRQRKIADEQ